MELGGAKVLFGLTINKLKYWLDQSRWKWIELDRIEAN